MQVPTHNLHKSTSYTSMQISLNQPTTCTSKQKKKKHTKKKKKAYPVSILCTSANISSACIFTTANANDIFDDYEHISLKKENVHF